MNTEDKNDVEWMNVRRVGGRKELEVDEEHMLIHRDNHEEERKAASPLVISGREEGRWL